MTALQNLTAKNTTILTVRIPLELQSRIEEFTNEASLERPSHAVRVLVEAALDAYDKGKIDVDRLSAIQHNANAEALGTMYEILAEVVERVTGR